MKKPKHKFTHMRVEPADNGGFTVHHSAPDPEDTKKYDLPGREQRNVFGSADEAHKHIGNLMGVGASDNDADDEAAPLRSALRGKRKGGSTY